jgi:hypoxanthine phosphoribosyltransferase
VGELENFSPENAKLIPVFTPEEIQKRIAELAQELSRDLKDRKVVLLGVLKGAFLFMADLAKNLTIPAKTDFVRLSSYGDSDESSGTIVMTKPYEMDLSGHTVVIVEDIIDTGLTLKWLKENLLSQPDVEVKCVVLIDKAERREVEVPIDYVGFNVPDGFLVGYGLDYAEDYRCLPGIYELAG